MLNHTDVSVSRQISNGLPFLFVGHRILNGTLNSHFSRAVTVMHLVALTRKIH